MKTVLAAAFGVALALTMAPSSALAEAKDYRIDRSHAAVSFTVSHVGFSDTLGRFREFDADIRFDPDDPTASDNRVEFVIQAASIDTDWERRDDHIRGSDFLDASNHPEIRFVSTSIEPLGNDADGRPMVRLHGDMILRGVTGPAVFDVVMNRRGEMRGREVIGFTATGTVNRTEFGIDFLPAIGAEIQVWISLEISPTG